MIQPYIGQLFLYYENYWGSGELGCYQAYMVMGPPHGETPNLTPVEQLAHTCQKVRSSKKASMQLDYYRAAGQLLWIDSTGNLT